MQDCTVSQPKQSCVTHILHHLIGNRQHSYQTEFKSKYLLPDLIKDFDPLCNLFQGSVDLLLQFPIRPHFLCTLHKSFTALLADVSLRFELSGTIAQRLSNTLWMG